MSEDSGEEKKEKKRKWFVLDTNVLIHDPESLHAFEDNNIIIFGVVIRELDKLKNENNGTGFSAREANRILDSYSENYKDNEGVLINNDYPENGRLFFDIVCEEEIEMLPLDFKFKGESIKDDVILAGVLKWQRKMPKEEIILVTKDINLRNKATACKVKRQDYKKSKVVSSLNEIYTGFYKFDVPTAEINNLYFQDDITEIAQDEVKNILKINDISFLSDNQCCSFFFENFTNLTIYKKQQQKFKFVKWPKKLSKNEEKAKLYPRNERQVLIDALLRDPDIWVASISGKAGTGKTLWALKVGYDLLVAGQVDRIMVFRPLFKVDDDVGFLPGDLKEKFSPYVPPIKVSLDKILKKDHKITKAEDREKKWKELIESEKLTIYPITFIKGCTFDDSFIIIDEAQDFTPSQIKAIATRAGEGAKVVFVGDLTQISNQYLDSTSSGFTDLIQKLKGQNFFGHIELVKSERSKLVELINQLL